MGETVTLPEKKSLKAKVKEYVLLKRFEREPVENQCYSHSRNSLAVPTKAEH